MSGASSSVLQRIPDPPGFRQVTAPPADPFEPDHETRQRDLLQDVIYQADCARYWLSLGQYREVLERLEAIARPAMAEYAELGGTRAPMVAPWSAVMPRDWDGPRDWHENDCAGCPRCRPAGELIALFADAGDGEVFEVPVVPVPADPAATCDDFDAVLEETWRRQ